MSARAEVGLIRFRFRGGGCGCHDWGGWTAGWVSSVGMDEVGVGSIEEMWGVEDEE